MIVLLDLYNAYILNTKIDVSSIRLMKQQYKYKFDDKDKVKIYNISNHHVQIYVSAAVEMMIGRLIACADR